MSAPNSAPTVELQAYFPDEATLERAINRLESAGFPRGVLSPPEEHPNFGMPNTEGNNDAGETDKAQLRTLGTGMAGYAGAAAVAGATIATGGAAGLAVAAAAAVGAGSAAAATAAGRAADETTETKRNVLGIEGHLVLGVRTETEEARGKAEQLLREAGATRIEAIQSTDDALTAGISAASWTGN